LGEGYLNLIKDMFSMPHFEADNYLKGNSHLLTLSRTMTGLFFAALFLACHVEPAGAQQKTLEPTMDLTTDVRLDATDPLWKNGFPDVSESSRMLTLAGIRFKTSFDIKTVIDEPHWLPEPTLYPIYSEEAELMDLNTLTSGNYHKSCLLTTEDADCARLASQTGLLFGMGLVTVGILWTLPESISGWDDEDITLKGMEEQWWDNVSQGPEWDNDQWYLNYILHPYCGGVYYQIARNSGYSQLGSFVYTTLMSTFFWEYGFEAFAEVPSIQDLIVTPVGGWLYGEWAYKTEKAINANEDRVMGSKWLGNFSLFLLDPINSIGKGFNRLVGHEWVITGSVTPIGPSQNGNPNSIGPISIFPRLNFVLYRRF
jgi:hypothetical protein